MFRDMKWNSIINERMVITLLFMGLFLGCAIVPPVPIELTRFADDSGIKNLTFDSAGSQPFDLTLTKYTVVGNNSLPPEGGVITRFAFTACPIEHMGSNVSNLTMHWPTGGSAEFYSGTLDSCQEMELDPLLFNEYLAIRSADSHISLINNPGMLNLSLGAISFLMMKNPHMYHYDEPVTYTFAVPYGPISIIANISGEEIPEEYQVYENTKIQGIRYKCRAGDGIRTMYGPTRSWNISMSLPAMDLTDIGGPNLTNKTSANATFSLFDLPCPAYGAPGKYSAEVTELYVRLTNYTGPLPQSSFRDDFDTATLNPHWDLRLVNGSGLAELDNDYLNGHAHLRSNSPSSDSGILMYYSDAISPPTDEGAGAMVEAYFSGREMPDQNYSGIFFLNETSDPDAMISLIPRLRGIFAFDDDGWIAYCPTAIVGMDPPNATGALSYGPHTLAVLIRNNATAYLLDGSPVALCEAPPEDFYVAFTSDPLTDAFDGNITLDYVEIMDVEYVTGYNGTLWMDMSLLPLGASSYADVIVCDCPDQYNRNFTFNISSDTPGIVEISNVNVMYGALISYGETGMAPTSSIENSDFSWVAMNSRISNSNVLYQTGLYNSTITDSEVVFSSLPCYNVSNSEVVLTLSIPPTEMGEEWVSCDNRIENSRLNFVILAGGGSTINSRLSGFAIAFTDFQDALVENLTLYEGTMILNGTRSSILQNPLDLGSIPFGMGMPLSLKENTFFVMDSAADLSFGNLDTGSIDCRFKLFDSNVTIYNLSFRNEFGGVRAELRESTLYLRDMPGPINITIYGGDTDLVFWDVNTSDFGTLILSSEDLDVDNGFASVDGEANGGMLANLSNNYRTTLIFYNLRSFDGKITYYENFTRNYTEAMEFGVECPDTICTNVQYSAATRTLQVDVSNFSTYVINYTQEPPTNGGSDPKPLSVSISGNCVGSPVGFTAMSDSSSVEGVDITIIGPDSLVLTHVLTGQNGEISFTPGVTGTYTYWASASGYRTSEGRFSIIQCEGEQPPPSVPEVPQSSGDESITSPEEPSVPPEPPEEGPVEVEVPAVEPVVPQPPAETQPSIQPAPPAPQACCFFGMCSSLFGICWYWWILALILIIGAAYYLAFLRK